MRQSACFASVLMLALFAGAAVVHAAQAPAPAVTAATPALPAAAQPQATPPPIASATPPASSGASSPAGPKPDSVSVDTTPGYARILFTFTLPAPVTAQVADGVVT